MATCVEAGESYRELGGTGIKRAPKGKRTCKGCGCTFKPTAGNQKFHDTDCSKRHFSQQDRRKAKADRDARAKNGMGR
jgi:hypothetical protein